MTKFGFNMGSDGKYVECVKIEAKPNYFKESVMNKLVLTWVAMAAILMLTACSSAPEIKTVKAMQRKDKNLSCKEVLLEMNEADFYKKAAYKSRGPNLKNVLMPLGYISTYMDADEAIKAADARVAYLDRIYEILQCDEKQQSPAGYMPGSYNGNGANPYGYYPIQQAPQNGGYIAR